MDKAKILAKYQGKWHQQRDLHIISTSDLTSFEVTWFQYCVFPRDSQNIS